MRAFTNILALAAPLLASAAPLFTRQSTTVSKTDILVLKFALVLEKLENEFYSKAIEKFKVEDFIAAGYTSAEVAVEQLLNIQRDEKDHQTALTSALEALGQKPLEGCVFNLDPFLTDVATTMTAARLVEVAGVGAYIGASTLVSEKRILLSAATIMTMESRHGSLLNILNGGIAVPQSFDIPLRPEQVLAIAGPLISGCDLGIKANAPLTITADGDIGPGTKLSFASPGIDAAAGKELFCNMIVGGAAMSINLPIDECVVPPGVVGPVAIIITCNAHPLLASNIIDQAQEAIIAGPGVAFVDFGTPAETIARLVLQPDSPLAKDLSGAAPVQSKSTDTISPDQASSSIDYAGGAAPTDPATEPNAPYPTADDTPPVLPTTQVYKGDVIPMMPTGAGEPAPAPSPQTLPPAGSDGLPDGSAGVDYPAPTGGPVEPAAGGAVAGGDIVPLVGGKP